MDTAKPADMVASLVDASVKKLALSPRDMLIRGAMSGALLGATTSFSFTAAVSTGQQFIGAMVFPAGFAMIMVLGLEIVTGNFALLPLASMEGKSLWSSVIASWYWVFLGNLLGAMSFGALLAITLTSMGAAEPTAVAARIVAAAELKTVANGGDIRFDGRQDPGGLAADRHLCRAWLRALRRQHVRDSHGHAAGSEGEPFAVVDVESDSRHAWKHRRRLLFHRARTLLHLQARNEKGGGHGTAGRRTGSRGIRCVGYADAHGEGCYQGPLRSYRVSARFKLWRQQHAMTGRIVQACIDGRLALLGRR